jgi:hypothetical protein
MSGMRGIIDAATAVKPGLYPTFELWSVAANAALLQGYGIDYPDAGADEDDLHRWYQDHLERGESVQDCARAFAEDYDLYEPDAITAQDLKRTHPIPPPPTSALEEDESAPGPGPHANPDFLLKAAYDALNAVPRTRLYGLYADSYKLAAAVGAYQQGDKTVPLPDLLKSCKDFLNAARNTRLNGPFTDTYALAHAFDLAKI